MNAIEEHSGMLIHFILPQKLELILQAEKHAYLKLCLYYKITSVNSQAHRNNPQAVELIGRRDCFPISFAVVNVNICCCLVTKLSPTLLWPHGL